MIVGPWKAATIDIDRATEFAGDDVDQYSSLVDLDGNFKYVVCLIPTIDSATTGICVQMDDAIATVPVPVYEFDGNATGDFLHATTAATTAHAVTFNIGGCQHIRIKAGGNQAADKIYYVRGSNGG